ncbi:hypothetical protein GH714_018279 [Hevea brasiliensis]|uniref:Uncharacterized protein n=1 Tax=Hevea brasiliensis TaxID=3981 RepID=A0A6A6KCK4_HEVBR|nr:hypothetical protein GH714_018279 [Hevea brasiliensis]
MVHVGGKFTEGPMFNYLARHVIKGCWTNCCKVTYEDIENRLKNLGYADKVDKIGYYKTRGDWQHQTLVNNDAKEKNGEDQGEMSNTMPPIDSKEIKNMQTQVNNETENVHTQDRNENEQVHSEVGNEKDESLVEKIETDDQDYMIVMQNRKALRASHGGKVQVDRNWATSGHASDYEDSEDDGFDTPYTSDENDLGEIVKRKRKKFGLYNRGCDHTKFELILE